MGSVCASREDSPREALRQYESYTSLWHEVITKLSDDVAFTNECSKVYQEECAKRRLQQLTKQLWQEMTISFVNRISCDDQRTKERIYRAVDGLYLGPGERAISEATFVEFTRLALTLAERDLRERIAKIQDKCGGVPPMGARIAMLPPFPGYGSPSGQASPQVASPPMGPPPLSMPLMLPLPAHSQGEPTPSVSPASVPPRFAPGASPQQQHHQQQLGPCSPCPLPPQLPPGGPPDRPPHDQHPGRPPLYDGQASQYRRPPDLPPPALAPRPVVYHQVPASASGLGPAPGYQGPRDSSEDGESQVSCVLVPDPYLAMPHHASGADGHFGGGGALQHPDGLSMSMSRGFPSGLDPRDTGELKPPALGGGVGTSTPVSPTFAGRAWPSSSTGLHQEEVNEMKRQILCGNLRVFVFNRYFELQAKRLALNPNSRRLSILRDDGLCEDSWEIDSLRWITQGIHSSVLSEPVAQDRAAAFRFKFEDATVSAEDRFLCVIFDSAEYCQYATEAFSQLCEVPVYPA